MTRREQLEAEIAERERLASNFRTMADDNFREAARLADIAEMKRKELAYLPPDPPPFRVSEAVSRKALEARRGPLTPPYYDAIADGDRIEHAALIQAWVEEQFPNNVLLFRVYEIRAKAGLT